MRRRVVPGRTQHSVDVFLLSQFEEALDDDLNIAGALGVIFSWAKELFGLLDEHNLSYDAAQEALAALNKYDSILGVIYFNAADSLSEEIETMIRERDQAREARDWATADRIREQLLTRGIILEDTPTGTVWKKR